MEDGASLSCHLQQRLILEDCEESMDGLTPNWIRQPNKCEVTKVATSSPWPHLTLSGLKIAIEQTLLAQMPAISQYENLCMYIQSLYLRQI
ncbi:hypothetical protein NPIL_568741 [Nephila pilipes]|uniref:Uncharacterized protein n=1 Tax=Nephila pilipes TaxID=299642 RepID=A0A8X6P2J9_NEPPI|nr:hypothetical protein NPIL_568741 [Nephila pilipes]